MGNLGPYQDIVTAAKRVGGVQSLIKAIEDAAIAKAFPKAFGQGSGAGALGTLAVGGVTLAAKRNLDKMRAREARANEAKEQLKTKVGGSMKSDGLSLGNGAGKSDCDGQS
ncbi:hypothetical protein [Streptomyces sp. NPDC005281]|uniref:hypothetical protein n=1 Tax=Streptomyces sp. NPDC005281 TaxID=3155712 RepID=UPI0033AF1E3A